MEKPTLLLCNIHEKKRAAVQVIALRCGCRVRVVDPTQFGATLGDLLGGSAGEMSVEAPFTEELLVMANLTRRQFDTVLGALRQARVPIALKAVLTPTNAAWTVQALYEELCREREAFAAGERAHE